MNKHTYITLMVAMVALAGIGLFSERNLPATLTSECVGKPYATPGCPLKSSAGSSVPATCGNGVLDGGEECDMGKSRNGTGNCTTTCTVLYCGDGVTTASIGEECEPQSEEIYVLDPQTNQLTTQVNYLTPSCGLTCTAPLCDEGGTCAGGCKRKFLAACVASASSIPAVGIVPVIAENAGEAAPVADVPVQGCGNGSTESGEQCDDGNQIDTDSCSNVCRLAVCGDGIVQLWEQCDDANRVDTDSCSNTCKSPACGDGVTQVNEECDDGNQVNTDTCSSACKMTRCGDGIRQETEECDDGNQINTDVCSNECKVGKCGDGLMQAGEECDDGNQENLDTCSNQCQLSRCGDGQVQAAEECDDGNRVTSDGCSNLCKLPSCGNAVREGEEECDDGNQINSDTCTTECKRPLCGDGFLQAGEYCDDGNDNNDDACTSKCRVPTCGDGLVQEKEECDDGRKNSDLTADACRRSCKLPRCGDKVKDEGEECDGTEQCSPECTALKPAAAIVAESLPSMPIVIGLAGFGSLAVLAYILRKQLHKFIGKVAGEDVARSLDDIPLDQIEMPWHKW